MDASELKEYLIEDESKIEVLLDSLGMHHIKNHRKYFSCGMPEGDNESSTIVYKDNLSVKAYTRDIGEGNDIFTLIMYIKNMTFPQSIRYIHNLFNLKYTFYGDKVNDGKIDLLARYKRIKKKKHRKYDYHTHPEYILKRYDSTPHVLFTKDGILPSTIKKFDIRYDDFSKRIMMPHRKWDTGEILGIFGRTIYEDYKDRGLTKYWGSIPFDKGGNVYGLDLNYKYIKECGYVVVFESEKSVLQCDSFDVNNTVAVGCADISEEQIRILLSLNVDIVIAFDKGLKLEKLDKACKPFLGKRNVYYIMDKDNITQDKDSPSDNGVITYQMLLDEKIRYKGEIK